MSYILTAFVLFSCITGTATRHDAIPTVLHNKPDRIAPDVDGYIAMRDCAEINNRYYLVANDTIFLTQVVDCTNREHVKASKRLWKGKWLLDIGEYLWRSVRLPNKPNKVTLCSINSVISTGIKDRP